jgi:lysozyme family protein
MMASDPRFEACLPLILKEEGGNNDDPQDHGGRTSRGITQREYSPWRVKHGLPDRDVFEASTQEVHDIYYGEYWLPRGPKLHPGVDLVYFNFAVNAGAGEAHKLLMRSIGPADVDDDAQTIDRMCNEGEAFYRGLAQFPRYGRGWTSRTERIRAVALKMQAEFPVTPPQPQPQETTAMNPLIIVEILSKLPTLVKAVQDILASNAAHTIESAVMEWTNHNTKGQPNSAALNG